MTWWQTPAEGDEKSFVVLEGKLHDPPAWKRAILQRMSMMMSQATQGQLSTIKDNLRIEYFRDDSRFSPEHAGITSLHLTVEQQNILQTIENMSQDYQDDIAHANLLLTVNDDRATRIRNLLAQEKRDKDGNLLPYTNAYRFTACHSLGGGMHQAIACLGISRFKVRINQKDGAATLKRTFDMIPATTGFQQLLQIYLQHESIMVLPRELRNGTCQQVAQDVMSYLGQLYSSKVTGDVKYPTVENRDPAIRRMLYSDAINTLVGDLRKLNRVRLRDKYPADYADDDPRGNREIVDDERWFAVTRSPDPHPIPLFFVNSRAVTILEGCSQFDAGISKKNRHRGATTPSEQVRQSRSLGVRKKGHTSLQSFYAALPILDTDDPVIQDILRKRDELHASGMAGHGRGLDQKFTPVPIMHMDRWRKKDSEMLVLLSGNRDRFERVLRRSDLEIAWTRIVEKDGEWYLQITLRIKTPKTKRGECPAKMIGVSFGIDAIATWTLIDVNGTVLKEGAFAPNEQILTFMKKKSGLEWSQEKQRWVGGRDNQFAKHLESIAHGVVNQLIELVQRNDAQLALEDISWVQKAGRDHALNMLFTAWNYGQLRRFGEYKAPLAHLDIPVFVSDYKTKFTCPNCGACRKAGEKPERATTWRENGTLHCRPCQQSTTLTAEMKAYRVALEAIAFRKQ